MTLEPQSRTFTHKGKPYVTYEASEGAYLEYNLHLVDKAKPKEDGKPTDYAAAMRAQSLLVRLCTFEETDSGTVPVTEEFVLSLPSRSVKELFDWIQTVSEMKGDAEKNSPAATTVTSV